MKKVNLVLVLAIAFALLLLACVSGVVSATTIYMLDDYAKIQWAVNNASAGDALK